MELRTYVGLKGEGNCKRIPGYICAFSGNAAEFYLELWVNTTKSKNDFQTDQINFKKIFDKNNLRFKYRDLEFGCVEIAASKKDIPKLKKLEERIREKGYLTNRLIKDILSSTN